MKTTKILRLMTMIYCCENDYSFFYKNLQENVAKRIAAYKAK